MTEDPESPLQSASTTPHTEVKSTPSQTRPQTTPTGNRWSEFWERVLRMGLGEIALRVGTALASIVFILLVIWVMSNFYLKGEVSEAPSSAALAQSLPTATSTPDITLPVYKTAPASYTAGIPRLAMLHTTLLDKSRWEVLIYEVKAGDTLFGIAEKFRLKPQTLLWGNYATLADDPHRLRPGQKLNILPVDGTYYQWKAGDTLTGVARFFGVKVEDILNWPGNKLTAPNPGEQPKTPEVNSWVVVPGGKREFASWSAPRITRTDTSSAKVLGPGSCGSVTGGAMGTGSFKWPAPMKTISGYDYTPATNHWGIDIACRMNDPIYAADSGVVVYAGWNTWGYGNIVIIDHGNGWQSLYAHLNTVFAGCSASVAQGVTIGACGSTGNSSGAHLHFELMSGSGYRVNPWDFLHK
ncbi:MAG TPA: M23 family metallopeptidase [Anaerolineaceae bacterium]